MAESAELQAVEISAPRTPKDKSCLLEVIGRYWKACAVDRSQPVLVLGGEQEDIDILTACGFEKIVLSNLDAAGKGFQLGKIAPASRSSSVGFSPPGFPPCPRSAKATGGMVRVCPPHGVISVSD